MIKIFKKLINWLFPDWLPDDWSADLTEEDLNKSKQL